MKSASCCSDFVIIFFLNFKFSENFILTEKRKNFQFIQIFENIFVDIFDFEKIFIDLLFFNLYCVHLSKNFDFYKFFMCFKFNEIVFHQWTQAIQKFSSLILIIAFEKKFVNVKLFSNWISAIAMREVSSNLKKLFVHFRYVFDQNDSKIPFVILLIFYDIFVSRSIFIHKKITVEDKIKKFFRSQLEWPQGRVSDRKKCSTWP